MSTILNLALVWGVCQLNQPAPPAAAFPNAAGWTWLLAPMTVQGPAQSLDGATTMAEDSVVFFDVGEAQGMRLILATAGGYTKPGTGTEFRVVAFDEKSERHAIAAASSAGNDKFQVSRFSVSSAELPLASIRAVGLEKLTPEGRRVASAEAALRARREGVEVLPLPTAGAPFRFELTDATGKKIRSEDYLGKVLLIDCWATWCTPCMEKMPTLKKLYEEWQGRGFDLVGVNFDHDRKDADEAIKKHNLPWPQCFVPNDDKVRDLWNDVAGIRTLPRLLLIDRQGTVVDADLPPHALEERIAAQMRAEPFPPVAKP